MTILMGQPDAGHDGLNGSWKIMTMSNSFCPENRILEIIKADFAFLDFGQFKSKIRLN